MISSPDQPLFGYQTTHIQPPQIINDRYKAPEFVEANKHEAKTIKGYYQAEAHLHHFIQTLTLSERNQKQSEPSCNSASTSSRLGNWVKSVMPPLFSIWRDNQKKPVNSDNKIYGNARSGSVLLPRNFSL